VFCGHIGTASTAAALPGDLGQQRCARSQQRLAVMGQVQLGHVMDSFDSEGSS
jgi:hypothetical protein